MLPFKYRKNKISSIRFRNVSTFNRKYYIEVEPLYGFQPTEDVVFRSQLSSLCIVSNVKLQ